MITRALGAKIKSITRKMPVIAVTDPRQSGKPTLIKQLFPEHKYLNLEDIELRQFALADPLKATAQLDFLYSIMKAG